MALNDGYSDCKGQLCWGGLGEETLGWEPEETLAPCGHQGGKDINLRPRWGQGCGAGKSDRGEHGDLRAQGTPISLSEGGRHGAALKALQVPVP